MENTLHTIPHHDPESIALWIASQNLDQLLAEKQRLAKHIEEMQDAGHTHSRDYNNQRLLFCVLLRAIARKRKEIR